MVYPKQTDNYDVDIFNQNFRELDTRLTSVKGTVSDMEGSVSDAFSETKTYATGDYCIYLNKLYKFTAAKDAGPWDGTKVVPCTVMGEIGSLNGALFYSDYNITLNSDSSASPWNAYGGMSIAVPSAIPISSQITGTSHIEGSTTININTNTLYVFANKTGECTIRVLYVRTR